MSPVPMYELEERERRIALIQFNNTCVKCGNVAWSVSLEALMQLRPKRGDPKQKELLCGECCAKLDGKKSARGRAA